MISVILQNPKTVALLEQYKQYVADHDGIDASPAALIEGVLLGFLDEHEEFRHYQVKQCSESPCGKAPRARAPITHLRLAAGGR